MKNSSEHGPTGNLKKAALIGGGTLAAAAGGAGAARLLRKQKLRIGPPLSKSKIVGHMPGKTRQAAGRVVDLSARLDAVLRDFAEISTEEQPYSYGGDYERSNRKPRFPSLYLSRSTDKGIMKLPGEGRAVISYKVKTRRVDEDTEDGAPLYGGDIEVRSIEPIGEDGGTELSETLYLRHLSGARDRDPAGRFSPGGVPKPDDYTAAAALRKKKAAGAIGGAGLLGAAALGGTAQGRALGGGLVRGAIRGMR